MIELVKAEANEDFGDEAVDADDTESEDIEGASDEDVHTDEQDEANEKCTER